MGILVQLKILIRDLISIVRWGIGKLRGRLKPVGFRILLYHALCDIPPSKDPVRMSVPPKLFERQIDWLQKRGYQLVSFDQALNMLRGQQSIPPKAVLITFDDGFDNFGTQAVPVLERAKVPATLFVVPQFVGTPQLFPWLSDGNYLGKPLSWEQLRQLSKNRLFSIGSHSWNHRPMSGLTPQEQLQDLQQSRELLQQQLGLSVRWFAYPFGAKGTYSTQTIESLQQAGYEAACSNLMGASQAGDSLWEIKRTRIGWEDNLWRFRLKLAGVYDWMDQ